MKTFFRHFLFLILCLSCYTASAGTDDNVGYIVGNSYGVGPSDQKWRETGPNGDATVIFRYATSTNNLVFYKPTQLGPTGVKLQWSQLDTASGGGFLYCNRSDSTSGSAMRIENAMVDSGKMYGSHKLFKTSVPGLYYTLLISNMWSAYGTELTLVHLGYTLATLQTNIFRGIIQAKTCYIGVATTRIAPVNTGL